MIAVGWGAMGSTDLTQLLSVLVIAQWCEARGQTRKDRGSNPRKVELSTHEWNTESGQHSVDQPPSTENCKLRCTLAFTAVLIIVCFLRPCAMHIIMLIPISSFRWVSAGR